MPSTPSPTIIAIDGPAGSGKSTVARQTAERLKLPYLDSGAMYRAVTLLAVEKKVPLTDSKRTAAIAARIPIHFGRLKAGEQAVWIGRRDVTRAIRMPELTQQVHHVAASPAVRRQLVKLQRRLARKNGGVVEGRDIGTVVFPKATHKFFLDAGIKLRSRRRYRELKAAGVKVSFQQILKDQKVRDHHDIHRKVGPLRRAKDAVYIDTTGLTITQTADKICHSILGQKPRRRTGRHAA